MKFKQPLYYILDSETKKVAEVLRPKDVEGLKPTEILFAISRNLYTEVQQQGMIADMFHYINKDFKHICTSKRLEFQVSPDNPSRPLVFVNNKLVVYLYRKEISILRQLDVSYFNEEILFAIRKFYFDRRTLNFGLFEMFYCIEETK